MTQATRNVPVELKAERLCRSFGEKVVLDCIDLTICAGDIVAIVGASGSGKTVMLDHLIGLMKPTSGRVLAADHNVAPDASGNPPLRDLAELTEDELDMVRLHWAVVFQRNALFSGSVRENIAFWLREHTTLGEKEIDTRIRDALASVSLDVNDVINKDRDALSGGMAKRVAIARAVATDPLVMFYDEPTTGLDPIVSASIHELIFQTHNRPPGQGFTFRDLGSKSSGRQAAHKRTTVIVTHDKELLRRIEPRVVMLHQSKIVFDGTFHEFTVSDIEPARAYLAEMPVLQSMYRSRRR